MPITIQGNWTVRLITQPIDQPQRFVITGAIAGNGTYSDTYTTPIFVQGTSWVINVQEYDGTKWVSANNIRRTDIETINGQYVFQVQADDYRGGVNYDDLMLELSSPVPPPPPQPEPPILPPPVLPPVLPPAPPTVPTIPTRPTPPVEISSGKVYTRLTTDDKLPTQVNRVYYGIWQDATGSTIGNMITYFTCSTETSESYRRTIYQSPCDSHCAPKKHFSIAYGHNDGSGSRDLGGYDWMSPSNAIYGQYRSLCLNPTERQFKIGSKVINHFYAIDVNRDRFGDRLDEGNLELNLHILSGSQFLTGNGNRNAHTGSNVRLGAAGNILRLIDDSRLDIEADLSSNAYAGFYQTVSESKTHLVGRGGEIFYIVSGTLEDGIYNKSQPHVYGLSYPRLGVIILDADLLDISSSFLTVTGSDVAGDNAMKLFTSLSGSALYTDASGDYLGFQARKVKYEYIEQYFIRVKNGDYNFTNNPSYQTGSEGQIIDDFYGNPKVYITQVGLYNENKELLAVGKISKPILKSYTEEALIQMDLKYE
jgi:hypothetical protein